MCSSHPCWCRYLPDTAVGPVHTHPRLGVWKDTVGMKMRAQEGMMWRSKPIPMVSRPHHPSGSQESLAVWGTDDPRRGV